MIQLNQNHNIEDRDAKEANIGFYSKGQLDFIKQLLTNAILVLTCSNLIGRNAIKQLAYNFKSW
jgi:hypothetical protein